MKTSTSTALLPRPPPKLPSSKRPTLSAIFAQSNEDYWYASHAQEDVLKFDKTGGYEHAADADKGNEVDEGAGSDRVKEDRETLVNLAENGASGNMLSVPEMSELIEEVVANLDEVMKGKKTIQKVSHSFAYTRTG